MTAQPTTISLDIRPSTSFDAPKVYERYLYPQYERSAQTLASRVARTVHPHSVVLDVACGTGIATEQLWRSLELGCEITAIDYDLGMLRQAHETRGHIPGITWRRADAHTLPFETGRFDATVCAHGLLSFTDRRASLAEMTRVTKPGGYVTFNLWDSLAHNRFAELAQQVLDDSHGGYGPSFLRTAFRQDEVAAIITDAASAGLVDMVAEVVTHSVWYDPRLLAFGLLASDPGVQNLSDSGLDPRALAREIAWRYQRDFGQLPVVVPMQEVVFTGQKPHG